MKYMGDPSFNIDLGDSLPYLEQRFLQIFGKDQATQEACEWFKALQNTAVIQTSHVHCIGALRPLPFDKVYQPTRLTYKRSHSSSAESFAYENRISRSIVAEKMQIEVSITVDELLSSHEDVIIYAGPGWGKTTFLHHIYRRFTKNAIVLPVLITLRRETAVEDLRRFVETASKIQKRQHISRILLLVDGYDELQIQQRRSVSESLLRYQAIGIGNFILSCRDYYPVYDIGATEVRIDRFSKDDKYRFAAAFLLAFGSTLDPTKIVDELEDRGLSDFLSHPLLLSLACILKTSTSSLQARSVIRLLERALELLCYQWDEKKGIDRECFTPLDGKDRLKVLRKIAYVARSEYIKEISAETLARKQLDLLTFDKLDPKRVLTEIAQFYGILIPTEDGWEFAHRTLHDFLAAQYWVESGEFAKVRKYQWNSRTAYAACLMENATDVLEAALRDPDGMPTVAEILSNFASFDMHRIKAAIIAYFTESSDRFYVYKSDDTKIEGGLCSDFVRLSNNRFLDYLVETSTSKRDKLTDLIIGYCLLELRLRGAKLDFQTYEKAFGLFKSHSFMFYISGMGNVSLGQLNPAPLPRLLAAS